MPTIGFMGRVAVAAASLAGTFGLSTAEPLVPSFDNAPMRRPSKAALRRGRATSRTTTNFTGHRNGAREKARRLRQIERGSFGVENGLVL